MQLTLLNSKTTVPRTVLEAIERQRLVDLLRYSGSKRLTVERAPAVTERLRYLANGLVNQMNLLHGCQSTSSIMIQYVFGNTSYILYQIHFLTRSI